MKDRYITHGFTRKISRSLANCELMYMQRQPFDMDLAMHQHSAYIAALEGVGVSVTILPELPELADSTFVEDTAIMFDEAAVICRFGVESRATEAAQIEHEIANVRPVHKIVEPGTVEGGDVLQIGKTFYVGLSKRTNKEGIQQLNKIVRRHGYQAVGVGLTDCLHLKSAVTSPAEGVLIVNPDWVDLSAFAHLEILRVPRTEPWGANTLAVNGEVFVTGSSPRTADLIEARGLRVKRINISELQKAEAALTCLSLLYSQAR